MHTIQLKVNEEAYRKFIQLMDQFKEDELEIVADKFESPLKTLIIDIQSDEVSYISKSFTDENQSKYLQ